MLRFGRFTHSSALTSQPYPFNAISPRCYSPIKSAPTTSIAFQHRLIPPTADRFLSSDDQTESNTVDKISAIARAMDRSRNWVIEDAPRQYIDQQAWYFEGMEQARKSLKAGKGIPHEEVMAKISELINERIGNKHKGPDLAQAPGVQWQ